MANSIAAICGSLTGSYLPSGSFSRSALVGEITGKVRWECDNSDRYLSVLVALV